MARVERRTRSFHRSLWHYKRRAKRALLLHLEGKDIRRIFETPPDTGTKYDEATAKLYSCFKSQKNTTQNKGENTSSYLTRLQSLAETCEFTDVDTEIRVRGNIYFNRTPM